MLENIVYMIRELFLNLKMHVDKVAAFFQICFTVNANNTSDIMSVVAANISALKILKPGMGRNGQFNYRMLFLSFCSCS